MMNIAKNESKAIEMKADNDQINDVFPVDANTKMSVFAMQRIMQRIENKDEFEKKEALKSLHPNGLDIPVETFKHYCKALKSQKAALVDKFLHSLGVEADAPSCRVSWEVFLQINCLMTFFSSTKE